jgi:hypothetical protein
MAQSRNSRRRSPERSLVTALWIVAASIFITGCVLRVLASAVIGYHLRITGVAFIAIGLAVAVLGWVGERVLARSET